MSGSPDNPPEGQGTSEATQPAGSATPTVPMPTLEPSNVPAGTPSPAAPAPPAAAAAPEAPAAAAASSSAPTAPPPAAPAPSADVPAGAGFIRVRLFGRTDVGRLVDRHDQVTSCMNPGQQGIDLGILQLQGPRRVEVDSVETLQGLDYFLGLLQFLGIGIVTLHLRERRWRSRN